MLFPAERSPEEGAVRLAIHNINRDTRILPNHIIEYTGSNTGLLEEFFSIQKGMYNKNAQAFMHLVYFKAFLHMKSDDVMKSCCGIT